MKFYLYFTINNLKINNFLEVDQYFLHQLPYRFYVFFIYLNGYQCLGSGDRLKFKPDKNFSAQSFCQTKSQNQQRFATVLRRRLPCVSSPPRCFLVLVPTQSCSGRHSHPLLYPPCLHGQACRCCCLRKFVSKLKRQSKMQLCSTTRSTIIRFHYNLLSYARNFD